VAVLTDPAPQLAQDGPAAAAVGVGLLVVDVVLPVPSSAVMVAHGALFGVVLGALLSLLGSVGAAMVGSAWGAAVARCSSGSCRKRSVAAPTHCCADGEFSPSW
jgi:hypothetical protein